jgi:hypothetical protein
MSVLLPALCGGVFLREIFRLPDLRRIVYSTQSETRRERLFSKAEKLRKKIGAQGWSVQSIADIQTQRDALFKTWMRIRWQIEILESKGFCKSGPDVGSVAGKKNGVLNF